MINLIERYVMAPKKLAKGDKATHPILVRKLQHKRIHSLAKKYKLRVTELVDIMIYEGDKYLEAADGQK